MFSLEILLMISAIVLCVGCLLGALISRTMFPPEQQKQLENNLKNSQQELEQYQQEVAKHFADTAELVQNLTQSYKSVHDHLAKGALNLTNPETTRLVMAAGDKTLGIEASDELDEHEVQPPRDWAPKAAGQTGTLSEEYGLNEHATAATEETKTSTPKAEV